jgi:hypothetical protein
VPRIDRRLISFITSFRGLRKSSTLVRRKLFQISIRTEPTKKDKEHYTSFQINYEGHMYFCNRKSDYIGRNLFATLHAVLTLQRQRNDFQRQSHQSRRFRESNSASNASYSHPRFPPFRYLIFSVRLIATCRAAAAARTRPKTNDRRRITASVAGPAVSTLIPHGWTTEVITASLDRRDGLVGCVASQRRHDDARLQRTSRWGRNDGKRDRILPAARLTPAT